MIYKIIMASLKQDIKTGIESEIEVFQYLKNIKKFRKIKKSEDQYCKYDFYNKKYEIELKTRNNTIKKFDTTLIPYNKVLRSVNETNDKRIILMFRFKYNETSLDKSLFYIKYDKDIFKTFKIISFKRHKRCGIDDHRQEYFEIPINKLSSILKF